MNLFESLQLIKEVEENKIYTYKIIGENNTIYMCTNYDIFNLEFAKSAKDNTDLLYYIFHNSDKFLDSCPLTTEEYFSLGKIKNIIECDYSEYENYINNDIKEKENEHYKELENKRQFLVGFTQYNVTYYFKSKTKNNSHSVTTDFKIAEIFDKTSAITTYKAASTRNTLKERIYNIFELINNNISVVTKELIQ